MKIYLRSVAGLAVLGLAFSLVMLLSPKADYMSSKILFLLNSAGAGFVVIVITLALYGLARLIKK